MQYNSRSENYSSSLRDSPSKWGGGNKENKGYAYKQASYQYSTSGTNNNTYNNDKSADKNIDQLDALLEDLKNEREITRDRDHSLNYRTIERSTNEDPLANTVTKTTRVVKKTTNHGGGGVLDDSELLPTADYSSIRLNGSVARSDYSTLDKSYGSNKLSPGGDFYEAKKTKVYESNRSLGKPAEFLPVVNTTNTSSTVAADLQEDFKNITINEDILPVPGTKVTTTVRTYTYEIPANGVVGAPATSNTLSRKNMLYNTVQTNETNNVVHPHPHPVNTIPQTVVYNTESYSTLNKGVEKPIVNNQSYEVREHYESNTMRNNTLPLQPRQQPPVNDTTIVYNVETNTMRNNTLPLHPRQQPPPVNDTTIVYNVESNTIRNNTLPLQPRYPPTPTENTIVYNINNTTTTTTERPGHYPHSPNLSPKPMPYTSGPHNGPHSPSNGGPPTTHRYYYKESTNTVNTIHGPGGPGSPPNERPLPMNTSPTTPTRPNNAGYPPNGVNGYPPNGNSPNTNTVYHYSSTTTNTNNRRGPDYGTPSPHSMPPAPFPVDGVEYPVGKGNPPQRVEELMQSFGNADVVDRHDLNTPRKREVETSVATPNQQQIVPSTNRAGRDVYYPPGHEMMLTKREEMQAGSQAGGRWAKGSGMYEYESGYKSKSKTKTSGAMVPVCLPLCCAMPCSIM